MTENKYENDGQQRLLALIRLMFGAEIEGLAPGEIAKAQHCAPGIVTRDLANLRQAGFAEQIEATGRWRLGPALIQAGLAHMTAVDTAKRHLGEIEQRFSRMPG